MSGEYYIYRAKSNIAGSVQAHSKYAIIDEKKKRPVHVYVHH